MWDYYANRRPLLARYARRFAGVRQSWDRKLRGVGEAGAYPYYVLNFAPALRSFLRSVYAAARDNRDTATVSGLGRALALPPETWPGKPAATFLRLSNEARAARRRSFRYNGCTYHACEATVPGLVHYRRRRRPTRPRPPRGRRCSPTSASR